MMYFCDFSRDGDFSRKKVINWSTQSMAILFGIEVHIPFYFHSTEIFWTSLTSHYSCDILRGKLDLEIYVIFKIQKISLFMFHLQIIQNQTYQKLEKFQIFMTILHFIQALWKTNLLFFFLSCLLFLSPNASTLNNSIAISSSSSPTYLNLIL